MDKPWIIVQYDNREVKTEYKILIQQNKAYCAKYGYAHIFETKPYDLPPYWIKVRLIKDLLDTNNYKGAMWLDTDAVIHNHSMSIDDLLLKDKSMYYCRDCPKWNQDFNAGVWIILNDKHGKEILDKWMNSYSEKDWTKENNKWTSSGTWAGTTYEQGAFTQYVRPQFEQYTHMYPWQHLQSYEVSPHTFAMHFAGELSDTYLPWYIFWLYVKSEFIYVILLCVVIILCISYRTFFMRLYKRLFIT